MISLSSGIFGCIAKAKKRSARHLCLILLLLPAVASGTESVLSDTNLRRVNEIYDAPSLRQSSEITPNPVPSWKKKHSSAPAPAPPSGTDVPSFFPTNMSIPLTPEDNNSRDEPVTDSPTSSPNVETDFPTSSPIAEETAITDFPSFSPIWAPTANPVKTESDDYYENLDNLDSELFDDAPTEESVSSDNKSSDDKSEIDEIKQMVLEGEKEVVRVAKDPTAEILAGVIALFGLLGMVFTGWQLLENPQGLCASICRLCVTCFACFCKVIFLPCRLCCDRHRGYTGSNTMDNSSFLNNEHTHDLELS